MNRNPIEIIEDMFQKLEEGHPFSINQLSKETGIHNVTIKRYIQLIEKVREEPELEVIKTSHSVVLRLRKPGKEPKGKSRKKDLKEPDKS